MKPPFRCRAIIAAGYDYWGLPALFKLMLWVCSMFGVFSLSAGNLNFPGVPPTAVINNGITVTGSRSVIVSWDPATDLDGDLPIYVVKLEYIEPGTTNLATISRETLYLSVTIDGLIPETSYRVRVLTTDGIYWNETQLFESTFTTPRDAVDFLYVPTGIRRVMSTNEWLLIGWQHVGNGMAFFLPEYRYRNALTNTDWIPLPRTRQKSAEITNVPPNTQVDFRVRASTGWLDSPLMKADNVYSFSYPITNTPSFASFIITNFASATTLGVYWALLDKNTNYYTYEVELKPTGTPTNAWQLVGIVRTNKLFITGLLPSTAYDVRVRATWGEFAGRWKQGDKPFNTAHKDARILSAPGPFHVSNITFTNALVSWGHGYGPEGVNLVYELEGTYFLANGPPVREVFGLFPETNAVLKLRPGVTYNLQVRARYGTATSVWFTASRLFYTPTLEKRPPSAPTNVRPTKVSQTSVTLEWNPSIDLNNDPIAYKVDLFLRDRIRSYTNSATQLTIEGLTPDTHYTYRIFAWDGELSSNPTGGDPSFRTLMVPDPVPPTTPGAPSAPFVYSTSASATWTPSIDYNGVRPMYEVQIRRNLAAGPGPWSESLIAAQNNVALSQLLPASSYGLRVRATDGTMTSDWATNEVFAITYATARHLAYFFKDLYVDGIETDEGFVVTWSSIDAGTFMEARKDWSLPWTRMDVPVERAGYVNRVVIPPSAVPNFFRAAGPN